MATIEIARFENPEFQTEYATNGGVDKKPDAFHFQFNPDSNSVCCAIIETVAFIQDSDQTDLDPLANSLNPDALSTLMESHEQNVTVVFQYEGMEITVENEGDIWLCWE